MGELPVLAKEFKEKIRERLQLTFVDLIPEETWDGMIEAEVKEALQPTIKAMVEEKLKAEFRPAVDKWVAENMTALLSPMLNDTLKTIAPMVAESFMRGQTTMIMETCMNMIRQSFSSLTCSCGAAKFQGQQCPRCGNW